LTQAAADHAEHAAGTARVAVETTDLVAARALAPALRRTFHEWVRVQTAREELDRILR
jgi:hypothetical protein